MLAGILSPYITVEELKTEFRLKVPQEVLRQEANINTTPFYSFEHFPAVLPVDNHFCADNEIDQQARCEGKDRAMHAANHFFITWTRHALEKAGLQDYGRVTNFIKVSANVTAAINNIDEAQALSAIAGLGWELKETLLLFEANRSKDTEHDTVVYVPTGAFDSLVFSDFNANDLGAITASNAFLALETEPKLAPLIIMSSFNSPEQFIQKDPYPPIAHVLREANDVVNNLLNHTPTQALLP